MDVIALSALRTGSVVWQPRRGSWVLTVVCKATFALAQTESLLAPEQEYPNEDDNHWNDDPARSLYSPSDLVPFKPRADVMVVGHAFAPRKEPVRSVVARVIVGEMSKAVEVYCDRSFAQDGSLREGPRFVKMPLRWERAAGGPESQNPVGMRLDARPDAYGTVAVPNLQPPAQLISSVRDFIEPVNLGPIAATWPQRRDRLGRHAATWVPSAWSQQPMPEDIDPSYFNAAPRDQQIEGLRPNERIILENLHPEHPRLVTNLPGVGPRGFVDRRGTPPQELSFVCDTLWIDSDRAICTLTWRAQVPIEHPTQPGRVLIASAEAGQRFGWADVERLAATHKSESTESTDLRMAAAKPVPPGPPRPKAQTLPFMRGMPDFPLSGPPPEPPKPRLSRVRDRLQETFDDGGASPATMMRPSIEGASDASPPWLAQARAALGSVPSMTPSTPVPPPGSPFGTPPSFPTQSGTPFVQPVARPSEPVIMRPSDPPAPPGVLPPPVVLPPVVPPVVVPPPVVPVVLPPAGVAPPAIAPPMPVVRPIEPPPPPVVSLAAPSIGMSMASSPVGRDTSTGAPPPNMGAIAPPAPVVQAAPAMVSTAAAATVGVAAASNAAAANARAAAAQQAAAAPQAATPAAAPQPKTGTKAKEIVDVLWFDPPALPRIRARAEWKAILEGAKPGAAKAPKKKSLGFDDDDDEDEKKAAAPAKDPPEVSDRRDLSTILARGEALEPDWLGDAISDAVDEDGAFMPPLVLTGGELVFPFDEVEQLKVVVTTVSPFIGNDKKLKEAVDNARELLDAKALAGGASGVAEGLTTRIREAFQQTSRMVPATYLDTQTERALLEQRHYQKRTVFGAEWVRALISPAGGGNGVPTYLPEELAKKLPMFQRFRARLIAEAHLAQDQYETSSVALKVVALARVMPIGIGAGAGAPAKPAR